MIVATVTFRYPAGEFDPAAYAETARRRRSAYEGLPGLILKVYWTSMERGEAGGIYLWETLAQAQATYSEEWRRRATQVFGVEPEVRFLDAIDTIQNLPLPAGATHH